MPLIMLLSRAVRSGHASAAAALSAAVSFGNVALIAVAAIVVSGIATLALVVRDVSDLTTGRSRGCSRASSSSP